MKHFYIILLLISCSEKSTLLDVDEIHVSFTAVNTSPVHHVFRHPKTRTTDTQNGQTYHMLARSEFDSLVTRLNTDHFTEWADRDVKWKNTSQLLKITVYEKKQTIIKELNDHNDQKFDQLLKLFRISQ